MKVSDQQFLYIRENRQAYMHTDSYVPSRCVKQKNNKEQKSNKSKNNTRFTHHTGNNKDTL